MTEWLTIAVTGYISVFLLGFNSRNVNAGNYRWAAGTSLFIGMSQGLLWQHVGSPKAGLLGAFIYAVSGGFGIISAMYVHAKYIGDRSAKKA